MDMNLMMKKGKLVRKSLSNLMSHHHHHHSSKSMTRGGFGIQEYEFSCSNSPNPVFFHKRKHHHFNFPCINHPQVMEEEDDHLDLYEQQQKATNNNNINMMVLNNNNHVVSIPRTPEYSFNFGPGEKKSPMRSSFSVRISNYSALDETDQEGVNAHVDAQAEDFIRSFYEQLRMQSRMQLLTTVPS